MSDTPATPITSTSTRFTMLPPNYLESQPASTTFTLQNLIDTSQAFSEEARQVLPYSFDECTYAKGYLRQAMWSCLGELYWRRETVHM
jgi:E3 ubiquitin-protein ligase UBR7